MEGFNQVIVIGNLGSDPELRYTQNGTAVLNVRMACTTSYKAKSGEVSEHTEWVSWVTFGLRAESLHKLLVKGSRVQVVGSLRTRSWEDKQGTKRYSTEVNAHHVLVLSWPEDKRPAPPEERHQPSSEPVVDDDIPF